MPDKESPTKTLDPAATDESSENARKGALKRRDPNEPSAVVGLGASAGGVAVLQQFFSDMPAESGLAFVVVMHLSPEHESNLAAIIQQKTPMPVAQVTEPVKVKPNHVYVIPPNHQLAFEDSTLRLVARQQAQGRRVTIDLFFRTLAQAYGQRGLCVILSGTDSDGAIGLKHIRAQGGVTIAQDPNEAEHQSMPLMAINTGMVDWVLSVSEMPAKLMEFVANEDRMKLPPEIPEATEPDVKDQSAAGGETVSDETRASEDESALGEVLAHLRAQTGHDFAHYKRATVLRRIARRLQVNSVETIPHYLEFLRKHPAEARALLQDLLIGVTHFFRDQESFSALEANVPQLFAGKSKDDQIRVWVPGCATGEEAYSIAMLLCEHAERLEAPPSVQIFASDIDDQAVHEARDGLYPSTIEADVSQERLRRFFARDHGRYRVRKALREKVLFASHNLLSDAPFSRLDLISCRNLLIYLNPKAQDSVFDIFHFALRSGALLFIGGSESSNVQGLFSPVDAKHRLFVRRSVPRPSWKVPMLPLRAGEGGNRARGPKLARLLPALDKSTVAEAATKTETDALAGQERRAALFGELHLKLLEQYAPPSLVVNIDHEVVHLSPRAGRYLQISAGEPSSNIFRLINPALQIELRTALFRAAQDDELTVTSAPQTVHFDGRSETISLQVRRVEGAPNEKFFLVLFEPHTDAPLRSTAPAKQSDVTRGLDDEIQYLKEQLSFTVQQYEAGSEELKASNEELQAMNEELRSTTEELETSKEELQSVNEELSTVNSELKGSVEELRLANTDLNNLMASTDIGTIFLTRDLRIHRFTPSAQKIFNLLPADINRPLSDITHKLHYEDVIADAMTVLDSLHTVEREVRVGEGHWYLVRIAPYRTAEDRIAGVVATFIEITRRKQAEEELRESEARYRAMFEQAHIGIVQVAADGRFLAINPGACALSGYTEAELLKMGVRDVTHPDDVAKEETLSAKLMAGEIADYTLEKRFIRKGGEIVWGNMTATLVKNAAGEPLYVLAILEAIGERVLVQEKLRLSEERFRQFAENSADVFWIVDARTRRVEYLNPVYEKMWGESRDAIMLDPEHWRNTVHPDDRAQAAEAMPIVLRGESYTVQYRIIRKSDGEIRWMRDTGFPIRNEAGEVYRVAGVVQDVTEDHERTEALRESEEKLRLVVEGAPDYAMMMLDPSNHIIYWNEGAERVFGWSADEALGKSGEIIFTPEDQANEAEEKEMAIARADGSAPDRRWHVRKDRSRIWVDGVMHRLDYESGELRGYAKIARDSTEVRNAEDQLRRAHDELEGRVRARTSELQTMNDTLGAEMKQRQSLEREILQVTERERARISQDLHDSLCQELTATALLLHSRAKSFRAEDPEASVALQAADALQEAAEMVNANAGLARDLARGLQPFELSAGLPSALRELCSRLQEKIPCLCEVPRSLRLEENIAVNLYRIAQEALTNASKHAHASKIVISLAREGRQVVLRVHDNGKAKSDKITPGMGIHMMQYRANAIGGTLEIKPESRKGTTVLCRLPIKDKTHPRSEPV